MDGCTPGVTYMQLPERSVSVSLRKASTRNVREKKVQLLELAFLLTTLPIHCTLRQAVFVLAQRARGQVMYTL